MRGKRILGGIPLTMAGPALESSTGNRLDAFGLRNARAGFQRKRRETIEHIELGAGIAHRDLDRDIGNCGRVTGRQWIATNEKPATAAIDQRLPAQAKPVEMFLVLRQEVKLPPPHRAGFAVIDLLRRKAKLFNAFVTQIDDEVEINFLLWLTLDLENDDPGAVGIEPGLLDRVLHRDLRVWRFNLDPLNVELPKHHHTVVVMMPMVIFRWFVLGMIHFALQSPLVPRPRNSGDRQRKDWYGATSDSDVANMGYEKARDLLLLARAMASSAEGLTLEEMCQETGKERRTVERMRDVIRELFPQTEEIFEHPTKRFRIPGGLDGFLQDPTAGELSDLRLAIGDLQHRRADGRADSLVSLERKITGAMRHGKRRAETDAEALLRAERIAVQAGPRAKEDPKVLLVLRKALIGMKMLRFTYFKGSTPGTSREVVPYGILFGRMNYLIAADAGTTKPKHFRLDHIESLECLDASGIPPSDFDLVEFANRSFGYFEGKQEDVVLHVLPGGIEDFKNYRFHASQTVEDHPSGGKIVRFRASGMPELACHLFGWSNKIEIVEPVSLRQLMTTELRVALDHHEHPLRFTYPANSNKAI